MGPKKKGGKKGDKKGKGGGLRSGRFSTAAVAVVCCLGLQQPHWNVVQLLHSRSLVASPCHVRRRFQRVQVFPFDTFVDVQHACRVVGIGLNDNGTPIILYSCFVL